MNTETETLEQTAAPEQAAKPAGAQKWQTEVGPRLTKQVEDALKEINWQHGFYKEKTGIIGVDEKEWCYNIVFGGRREDVASAWLALGDKYGWTITKPTMAAIIAEAKALVETLRASAPVVDKRVTIEQDTARKAEQAKAEQEREAVDAEKARAREAGTAKWRAQYPWAIQSGSSQARGAANIKRLLAEAFPGIAFSVKSSRFSGGDDITVSWEVGPTTKQVEEITSQFQEGSFDGMTDSYNYSSNSFHDWMGGAKYVKESRNDPDWCHRAIGAEICKSMGIELPADWPQQGRWEFKAGDTSLQDQVNQLFRATSFPAGSTIIGLEAACEANDYKQRLLLHVPARPPVVPASESTGANGATVQRNLEHNGVEVSFPSKPDQGVINELKGAGFRWSMRSKVWYKKYGGYAWAQAHRIAGIELPAEPPSAPSADPFDMAVEDRMADSAGVGGFEQPD